MYSDLSFFLFFYYRGSNSVFRFVMYVITPVIDLLCSFIIHFMSCHQLSRTQGVPLPAAGAAAVHVYGGGPHCLPPVSTRQEEGPPRRTMVRTGPTPHSSLSLYITTFSLSDNLHFTFSLMFKILPWKMIIHQFFSPSGAGLCSCAWRSLTPVPCCTWAWCTSGGPWTSCRC